MTTTAEHIAVMALRDIAKQAGMIPAEEIARVALEQIDGLNKPAAVHHLDAADVIIDKPPGGGFDF
jgi:hypothetical protein